MKDDMLDWSDDDKPSKDKEVVVETDDGGGNSDQVAEMMAALKATGVEDPGALYKAIKLVVQNLKS